MDAGVKKEELHKSMRTFYGVCFSVNDKVGATLSFQHQFFGKQRSIVCIILKNFHRFIIGNNLSSFI
jgi:hypothetical protein